MNRRQLLVLPLAGLAMLIAATFASAAPATQPTGPVAANVLDKFSKNRAAIDDAIRDAQKTREQDPMRFIARDMRVIGGDLGALKTNQPVQEKQQHVVADLDAVIKRLEEQCKSGGGGGSLNPSKPMT